MENSRIEEHSASRIASLDALRGIAVILMVQQHLGAWLWNAPQMSLFDLFRAHPLFMGINWLGNLAAPLFITLSGIGVVYLGEGRGNSDMVLLKRGIMLILFGYLLNMIACHWFSPGSWFVLHLIGSCLVISPLLVRLRTSALIPLAFSVLLSAALVQTWLDTPLYLRESRMIDTALPGGIFRLAAAEGHFPVVPWCSFFIMGIVAGRFIMTREFRALVIIGAVSIACGSILALLSSTGYAFAAYGHYFRVFVFLPYFFPALPPLLFMLNGIVLLTIAGAVCHENLFNGRVGAVLVPMGRISITVLIVHSAIFNEWSRALGLYKELGPEAAGLVTAGFLLLCGSGAFLWRRKNYAFGFEWLLRLAAR